MNLKEIRAAKGLTVKQAAEACGVDQRTYARWEALQPTPKTNIVIPHAKRHYVCHVLGIKRAELNELMKTITQQQEETDNAPDKAQH
jgi:transcriptional regulator with XRE-family HTH domain